RAAGGADMAALAAAGHWAHGGTAACARADRVAREQGARLVRCVLTGEVSDVSVASGRGPFTVDVRARAGPAAGAQPLPGALAPPWAVALAPADARVPAGAPDPAGAPTPAKVGALAPPGARDPAKVGALALIPALATLRHRPAH